MGELSGHRLRWWLRGERALGLRHVAGTFGLVAADEATPVTRSEASRSQSASTQTHANAEAVGSRSAAKPRQASESAVAAASAAAAIADELAATVRGQAMLPDSKPFTSAVLPPEEKAAALAELDATQVKGCIRCPLSKTRRNTVFGEGDSDSDLVFVGEGPGGTEDETGRPFVGRAGQKLTEIIEKGMSRSRSSVYICNVVKCRAYLPGPPPKDRPPQPAEAAACMPYLHRQLEIIRPKVIVTLGLSATQHLLGVKESMSRMRGRWHTWRGIKVMPTFHPSYVLRNYTPETRRAVWSDLQMVVKELATPGETK